VSLIGALAALVLVRQRDFVPSVLPASPTSPTPATPTTTVAGEPKTRTRSTPYRHAKQRAPKHRHAKRRHPAAASVTAVAHPPSPSSLHPDVTDPLGNDPADGRP
jgi:hypothetical protein